MKKVTTEKICVPLSCMQLRIGINKADLDSRTTCWFTTSGFRIAIEGKKDLIILKDKIDYCYVHFGDCLPAIFVYIRQGSCQEICDDFGVPQDDFDTTQRGNDMKRRITFFLNTIPADQALLLRRVIQAVTLTSRAHFFELGYDQTLDLLVGDQPPSFGQLVHIGPNTPQAQSVTAKSNKAASKGQPEINKGSGDEVPTSNDEMDTVQESDTPDWHTDKDVCWGCGHSICKCEGGLIPLRKEKRRQDKFKRRFVGPKSRRPVLHPMDQPYQLVKYHPMGHPRELDFTNEPVDVSHMRRRVFKINLVRIDSVNPSLKNKTTVPVSSVNYEILPENTQSSFAQPMLEKWSDIVSTEGEEEDTTLNSNTQHWSDIIITDDECLWMQNDTNFGEANENIPAESTLASTGDNSQNEAGLDGFSVAQQSEFVNLDTLDNSRLDPRENDPTTDSSGTEHASDQQMIIDNDAENIQGANTIENSNETEGITVGDVSQSENSEATDALMRRTFTDKSNGSNLDYLDFIEPISPPVVPDNSDMALSQPNTPPVVSDKNEMVAPEESNHRNDPVVLDSAGILNNFENALNQSVCVIESVRTESLSITAPETEAAETINTLQEIASRGASEISNISSDFFSDGAQTSSSVVVESANRERSETVLNNDQSESSFKAQEIASNSKSQSTAQSLMTSSSVNTSCTTPLSSNATNTVYNIPLPSVSCAEGISLTCDSVGIAPYICGSNTSRPEEALLTQPSCNLSSKLYEVGQGQMDYGNIAVSRSYEDLSHDPYLVFVDGMGTDSKEYIKMDQAKSTMTLFLKGISVSTAGNNDINLQDFKFMKKLLLLPDGIVLYMKDARVGKDRVVRLMFRKQVITHLGFNVMGLSIFLKADTVIFLSKAFDVGMPMSDHVRIEAALSRALSNDEFQNLGALTRRYDCVNGTPATIACNIQSRDVCHKNISSMPAAFTGIQGQPSNTPAYLLVQQSTQPFTLIPLAVQNTPVQQMHANLSRNTTMQPMPSNRSQNRPAQQLQSNSSKNVVVTGNNIQQPVVHGPSFQFSRTSPMNRVQSMYRYQHAIDKETHRGLQNQGSQIQNPRSLLLPALRQAGAFSSESSNNGTMQFQTGTSLLPNTLRPAAVRQSQQYFGQPEPITRRNTSEVLGASRYAPYKPPSGWSLAQTGTRTPSVTSVTSAGTFWPLSGLSSTAALVDQADRYRTTVPDASSESSQLNLPRSASVSTLTSNAGQTPIPATSRTSQLGLPNSTSVSCTRINPNTGFQWPQQSTTEVPTSVSFTPVPDRCESLIELLNVNANNSIQRNGDSRLIMQSMERQLSTEHALHRQISRSDDDDVILVEEKTSKNSSHPAAINHESSTESMDDDVIISSEEIQTRCPYTGKIMTKPVKNIICGHTYDLAGIQQYVTMKLQAGKEARCPKIGCTNSPLKLTDLIVDEERMLYINELKKKENTSS